MKKSVVFLLLLCIVFMQGCSGVCGYPDATAPHTAGVPSNMPTPMATVDAPTPVLESEAPTPTPAPQTTAYKCRANSLNIRSSPDTTNDENIIGTLGFEDEVNVIALTGDFYSILMDDGSIAYCYEKYLCEADEVLYGYVPFMSKEKTDVEGNIEYMDDGVTPKMVSAELVDVRLYIPDAEIFQIFATDNNVSGKPLYIRPVPVLQRSMAEKLKEAAEEFAKDGYTIKIYDLYRPYSVQFTLYDIVQNGAYISNPYKGASNHNRGGAIDMTLIGPDGVELEFPTPMHTFDSTANRNCKTWTEEQSRNVDYMTEVMERHGFRRISSEWWHFSDVDAINEFMVIDIPMNAIQLYTLDELLQMGVTF